MTGQGASACRPGVGGPACWCSGRLLSPLCCVGVWGLPGSAAAEHTVSPSGLTAAGQWPGVAVGLGASSAMELLLLEISGPDTVRLCLLPTRLPGGSNSRKFVARIHFLLISDLPPSPSHLRLALSLKTLTCQPPFFQKCVSLHCLPAAPYPFS